MPVQSDFPHEQIACLPIITPKASDQMPRAIALMLLFGLALKMYAHADPAQIARARWVIILTITDRNTGARLERHELDSDSQFDNLRQCRSLVTNVGPIPASDHFRAVLTCRKVERNEGTL